MADDRILQFLTLLTILLFVSTMVLPASREGHPWLRWARWSAVAAFALAVGYALWLTLAWLLHGG